MNDATTPSEAVRAWLDEQEGFAIRRERLYDHLAASPDGVVAWLETAFRMGMETAATGNGVKKGKTPDAWLAERRAEAEAARDFPNNTCPASRHLQTMADALADSGRYPMAQEDPAHVAGSIYAVLASLWEARSALAKQDPDPKPGPKA